MYCTYNTLEAALLVTKCVRYVQELKTHASESGQVIKKKGCTVSWPKCICVHATVQDGLLKDIPAAKVQISTSESGPKWRFKYILTAANFFIFYAKIWPLFPSFKMAFQG